MSKVEVRNMMSTHLRIPKSIKCPHITLHNGMVFSPHQNLDEKFILSVIRDEKDRYLLTMGVIGNSKAFKTSKNKQDVI